MDEIATAGRALPLFAQIPSICFAVILTGLLVWRCPTKATRFVMFAILLRLILAAAHKFSFADSPVGLSWNAVASIGTCFLGLFVLRRRSPTDIFVVAFYPLLAVMLLSGLLNQAPSPMMSALAKYGYFIVLTLAICDAIEDIGPDKFAKLFLVPYLLPLFMQGLSVAFNVPKPGEADGGDSFIGGFYHESAFSVTLAAAVIAACMIDKVSLRLKLALIGIGLASMMLANYRTAILCILPVIGIALVADISRRFMTGQKALVAGLAAVVVLTVGVAGATMKQDRFADLATVARNGFSIIKPPSDFSLEERRLMSGRPLIWSMFVYEWKDGTDTERWIGVGPENWWATFRVYAHNTLVSSLYETGILGALAMLLIWIWMFSLAFMVRADARTKLIAAHLGFFILNMATMPMWMIEGMILYALICAYTVYYYRQTVFERANAATTSLRLTPAAAAVTPSTEASASNRFADADWPRV